MPENNKPKDPMKTALELLKNQENLELALSRLTDESGFLKKTTEVHGKLLSELLSSLPVIEAANKDYSREMTSLKASLDDIQLYNNNVETRFNRLENALISRIIADIKQQKEISAEELNEFSEFANTKNDPDLFLLLTDAYRIADKPNQALGALERANALGSTSIHTDCQRGRLLYAIGRYEEAIKIFSSIQMNPKCSSDNGCITNILRFNAYALSDMGKTSDAIDSINQAIDLDDKNSTNWAVKGRILLDNRQFSECLGSIEKALEIDPSNVNALNDKAIALSSLGHNKEAIAVLDKAISIDASHSEFWKNRGLSYQALDMNEEAIADFTRAIELDNKTASNYCNRALSRANVGQLKEATLDAEIALDKGIKQCCKYCHDCIGRIFVVNKKFKEGLDEINLALEFSFNPELLVFKIEALIGLNRYEEANEIILLIKNHKEEYLEKIDLDELNDLAYLIYESTNVNELPIGLELIDLALTKETTEAAFLDTKACLLSRQSDYHKSLEIFELALQNKDSDNRISWLELANVYENLGREADAEEARSKAK